MASPKKIITDWLNPGQLECPHGVLSGRWCRDCIAVVPHRSEQARRLGQRRQARLEILGLTVMFLGAALALLVLIGLLHGCGQSPQPAPYEQWNRSCEHRGRCGSAHDPFLPDAAIEAGADGATSDSATRDGNASDSNAGGPTDGGADAAREAATGESDAAQDAAVDGATLDGAADATANAAASCSQDTDCTDDLICCGGDDGVCVDTQQTDAHCGACGNACGSGTICCDGQCIDGTTDDNCGECGRSCRLGLRCCGSGNCFWGC